MQCQKLWNLHFAGLRTQEQGSLVCQAILFYLCPNQTNSATNTVPIRTVPWHAKSAPARARPPRAARRPSARTPSSVRPPREPRLRTAGGTPTASACSRPSTTAGPSLTARSVRHPQLHDARGCFEPKRSVGACVITSASRARPWLAAAPGGSPGALIAAAGFRRGGLLPRFTRERACAGAPARGAPACGRGREMAAQGSGEGRGEREMKGARRRRSASRGCASGSAPSPSSRPAASPRAARSPAPRPSTHRGPLHRPPSALATVPACDHSN